MSKDEKTMIYKEKQLAKQFGTFSMSSNCWARALDLPLSPQVHWPFSSHKRAWLGPFWIAGVDFVWIFDLESDIHGTYYGTLSWSNLQIGNGLANLTNY